MDPLHFRDADGVLCCLAPVGASTPPGMTILGEHAVAGALAQLSDTALRGLWARTRGDLDDGARGHHLREWADRELAGPTARWQLWRTPEPPRPNDAPATTGRLAPIVDLRDLAPAPAPEHWAEVRVVDADGEPLAGVALTLVRADGSRLPATTDADGVARWRALPSGRTRVLFDEDEPSYTEER